MSAELLWSGDNILQFFIKISLIKSITVSSVFFLQGFFDFNSPQKSARRNKSDLATITKIFVSNFCDFFPGYRCKVDLTRVRILWRIAPKKHRQSLRQVSCFAHIKRSGRLLAISSTIINNVNARFIWWQYWKLKRYTLAAFMRLHKHKSRIGFWEILKRGVTHLSLAIAQIVRMRLPWLMS